MQWRYTYLAADTIFIDWVIFWIFVTDFKRIEMVLSVAILRLCWPNAPFARRPFSTGPAFTTRCIILTAVDYPGERRKYSEINISAGNFMYYLWRFFNHSSSVFLGYESFWPTDANVKHTQFLGRIKIIHSAVKIFDRLENVPNRTSNTSCCEQCQCFLFSNRVDVNRKIIELCKTFDSHTQR